MHDIVEFLKAREDEREAKANAAASSKPFRARGGVGAEWEGFVGLVVGSEHGEPLWDNEGSRSLSMSGECGEHVAANGPAFVLASVAANRKIITAHPRGHAYWHENEILCETCAQPDRVEDIYGEWPCETLKLLASVYVSHPDYRTEWAVE